MITVFSPKTLGKSVTCVDQSRRGNSGMQRAAFIVAAVLAALAMVGVVFLAAPPYASSGAVELDSFDDPGTSFN